jgi:hypothetical protein
VTDTKKKDDDKRQASTPAPPKPAPSATPSTHTAAAAPTATRPVAAKTPTAPPKPAQTRGKGTETGTPADDTSRRNGAPASSSRASTTPTPNPTKASTTPRSRTTKVTALSVKGSTKSPLMQHTDTNGHRTTVTLSHADKPSGKPKAEASTHHKTTVKTTKASSRVHNQLAKAKKPTQSTKATKPTHTAKSTKPAHAAKASHGSRSHHGSRTSLASLLALFSAAPTLKRGVTWTSPLFFTPFFTGETSVSASVTGPRVAVSDTGRLTVTWGDQQLFSMSLDAISTHSVELVEKLHALENEVKDGATVTHSVAGRGTITFNKKQVAFSEDVHGVTTTITVNHAGQLVISATATAQLPPHPPLLNPPVHLTVTTTLTPTPPAPPTRETRPVPKPVTTPSGLAPGLFFEGVLSTVVSIIGAAGKAGYGAVGSAGEDAGG